ncbi:hypothetical protein VPH219E481_0062 [Vibrio phage 219E48-1]|nr:hypothetical protein PODOV021v1_p0051 [Vibrio phage 219E41.2]QZI91083.1 putative antitoxin [Vibrio phage 219E41.1]QZI91100.1 hypothetical protein PODOV060v1_p0006 [Vibrio phage 234P8]QZI91519.1 hypothetical protein PODOV087v1_p0014 [Vibrio phage 431E45.1]QZI91618.1 hypothetical protein PODOV086v1_p0034 [Vibrio phage 431E46.1]QZI91728.1 hypothetical protein PODOV088v1_p0067 [Vibrio phage 431E48.2]
MFLPEYNSRQLQRESSKVQDEALKNPVVINRQGKPGTVLLSKEKYSELVNKASLIDEAKQA